MNIPISSILLTLGGKCLLNWTLVFLQRNHVFKNFLGVFSVSLAAVDTTLTLTFTTIHIQADGHLFLLGMQLTRYHVCLLVQILGQVYGALQRPVVVFAGLDHLCTVTQSLRPTNPRARLFVWLFLTVLLWYLAALHVLLFSDFIPSLEDVTYSQIHQCWVFHTSDLLQVAMTLSLTLGCAALYTICRTQLSKNPPLTEQSTAHSRRSVVHQTVHIFLNTWAPFLLLLALLPFLLPSGIPAYLSLNAAWLCFLNSFLIAVVLCVVSPASQLAQGLATVPPDSFCEWRFKFSLAADNRTRLHHANTHRTHARRSGISC